MRTNKQRTEGVQKKLRVKKARRRAVVAACICAVVTVFNVWLFAPYQTVEPDYTQYAQSEYYAVIKKIGKANYTPPRYKNNYDRFVKNASFGCTKAEMNATGKAPNYISNDMALYENAAESKYEETTDNQVAGVIEGDLLKRSSEHLFYLVRMQNLYKLRCYSIAGNDTALLSETAIQPDENASFTGEVEVYLSQDCTTLTVISGGYKISKDVYDRSHTVVMALDVSDPTAVAELGRTYFSGSYNTSRMVNGKLLLVNNFYVGYQPDYDKEETFLPQYGRLDAMESVEAADIYAPDILTDTAYTAVYTIEERTLEIQDSIAFLSYSDQVFVSAESLYVTRQYVKTEDLSDDREQRTTATEITRISYAGGALERKGAGEILGSVKNQYCMDEYNGVLRVAATYQSSAQKKSNRGLTMSMMQVSSERNASLYCLDIENMQTVGKMEKFAPQGEDVQSARFKGDIGYICTAEVITLTDPVYAFDLSDPTNIVYKDTGTIEGYSSSLVDFGEGYCLGIGYGSTRNLKIEVYAQTATAVTSLCKYESKESFSENYKSYYINREYGFIGLGVNDGYLLLQFNGIELVPVVRAVVPGYNEYKRAALIDGYFYIFTTEESLSQTAAGLTVVKLTV